MRHGGGAEESGDGSAPVKLSAQCRLLLLVNGLFATANSLSGTFVNVYLWKVKNDYSMIAMFNLSHHITMALVFWLAGKWIKEHNKMNALRTGVAVSAVFYSVVLLLGTSAVNYVVGLGLIQGISSALFWCAFNVIYFEVTERDTRDKFNGYAGLLTSAAGMAAPWISGVLITGMGDSAGYRLIFSISLAIFLVATVCSFFLKKRKPLGRYQWFYGVSMIRQKKNPWRKIGAAMIAQGIREGVFGFLIGLLVFIATGNELKLGNYALITSAIGLVSFMLAGRLLRPKFRKWAMLCGIIGMILVILPLFGEVSYRTLLIFGIGTALFIPLYSIPTTSVVFDIIGKNQESAAQMVEYIVLRELGLNFGRITGVLVFIAVVTQTTDPKMMNWLLLGVGSSPLIVWLLLSRWLRQAGVRDA
ncbi:MFS transporter [Paenibacillus senegalensis]|uniref:MFS transporter n=1 Tax=Paenibacillus senegalensis TaxID=1465766 RepID=UPI00028A2A54